MENTPFEKLSISLPTEMAKIIREKVGAGGYGSASEVIREAMRGWLDRQRRLAALDASIARGLDDADADRIHDIDKVRRELRERFAAKEHP